MVQNCEVSFLLPAPSHGHHAGPPTCLSRPQRSPSVSFPVTLANSMAHNCEVILMLSVPSHDHHLHAGLAHSGHTHAGNAYTGNANLHVKPADLGLN